jgi:hypothetical protein
MKINLQILQIFANRWFTFTGILGIINLWRKQLQTLRGPIIMANEKLAAEVAVELIRKAVVGTKIVEQANNTGTSFFQGKKRLGKVLNSKKGLSLEINVNLPKKVEEEFGLTFIPAAVAHAKHLGTMKYHHKAIEVNKLPQLVKAMMEAFKAEVEEMEKAQ